MVTVIECLERKVERLSAENHLLRQHLDRLLRALRGAKNEKIDPKQLQLLLAGLEDESPGPVTTSAAEPPAKVAASPKAARRSRRVRMPANVEVVEEVIVPEAVQACPEAWKRIGQEVSDLPDYIPGRFILRRTIRPTFVKLSDRSHPPVIAPLPERLQDRGGMAPGLLTHVVVSKYADHLPLYRQEWIYEQRYGVHLPRQVLSRAVRLVAEWFKPIVEEMSRQQFARGYVQIDETPIRYLDPGRGRTATGYLWTVHTPGGDTVYHWYPGRGHECLLEFVPEGFAGHIQCDGYSAYRTFLGKRSDITLLGCWTHLRRKFVEALDAGEAPRRCAWILGQIAHLYRIEQELRDQKAGPALREATRQAQSRMVAERIGRVIRLFRDKGFFLPKSLMGVALDYALGQWSGMLHWLGHGHLEIDNNLIENRIRPTAVGRKNWLFVGAEDAGWQSATLYSIVTSCRAHGIDPYAYIKDVLERIPAMKNHQIPELTPAAWAAARAQPLRLAS